MTIMENALKEAGVRLPTVKERIWKTVLTSPGITRAELARRLRAIPEGSIQSQTFDLLRRGMVYTSEGAKGVQGLHTDLTEYRLLPAMQEKAKPQVQAAQPVAAKAEESPEAQVLRLVENLTLRQARALYADLHRMFK